MLDLEEMLSFGTLWPRLVARSWLDAEFRQKLLDDPKKVLLQHDVKLPDAWKVHIIPGHETAQVAVDGPAPTLVMRLPDKPDGLTEELGEQIETRLLKCSTDTIGCW